MEILHCFLLSFICPVYSNGLNFLKTFFYFSEGRRRKGEEGRKGGRGSREGRRKEQRERDYLEPCSPLADGVGD